MEKEIIDYIEQIINFILKLQHSIILNNGLYSDDFKRYIKLYERCNHIKNLYNSLYKCPEQMKEIFIDEFIDFNIVTNTKWIPIEYDKEYNDTFIFKFLCMQEKFNSFCIKHNINKELRNTIINGKLTSMKKVCIETIKEINDFKINLNYE